MAEMTIGQLAAHTGLSVSAIRFYQRRGLLPARQPGSSWQRFDSDTVGRLRVIELAKGCGFTLDEIAELLDALYAPASPTPTWQAMGEAKLAELDAQAAQLQQMRRLLTEALSYCHLDMDRGQIIATALGWPDTQPDTLSLPR
jgi:MerR family transcriptional regulator, redox-sensitive transcriptional activator SoxR